MNNSLTEQLYYFGSDSLEVSIECSSKSEMNVSRLRKRTSLKKKIKDAKKKGKGKTAKSYNSSLWELKENVQYMQFLLQNQQLFYTSKEERKSIKLNVMMAKCVKTRSADQCRSHHQKMIKYHQDIPNIIRHIQRLMEEQKGVHLNTQQKQENQNEEIESLIIENPAVWSTQELPEPLYDWEYWINLNQIAEEEKYIEEWFDGVDGKYSHY